MVKRRPYTYALLALLCAALAVPSAGWAASGGSGLSGPVSGSSGSPTGSSTGTTSRHDPGTDDRRDPAER